MDNIYYIGLYYDDEFNSYAKFLESQTSMILEDFNTICETIKIKDNKYMITNIIKNDKKINLEFGDIIEDTKNNMISTNIYHNNKIIYENVDSLYVIDKKIFTGFIDNSIENMIKELYTKIINHINYKSSPYKEIEIVLSNYMKS